jgi:hypothetical protein
MDTPLATHTLQYRGVTITVEVDLDALGRLVGQRAMWKRKCRVTVCDNCIRVRVDPAQAARAIAASRSEAAR